MALLQRIQQWWFCLDLNLPEPCKHIEVDVIPGTDKPRRKATDHIIKLVLQQALADGASAIHFCFDEDDNCLRMLEYLPNVIGSSPEGWREFVPTPACFGQHLLRRLRRCAGVHADRSEGVLYYKHAGQRLTATCVSPDRRDARIYFAAERPTLLNKKAGDVPGG